ncbi:DNA oxidative demethylase ALKBH2 [Linum perenne]
MSFKQKTLIQQPTTNPDPLTSGDEATSTAAKKQTIDLGNGSEIVYFPRFLPFDASSKFFDYLDTRIPWTRPTVRVFGRSCLQPRETCYVASLGLPELIYSGYKPQAYSWDDYPPLKDILDAVHKALPGSRFNSLLLNRYKGGNDNVGWHADDEKLYGPTPEIASVSFGCEREFLMKKRPSKSSKGP